MKKEKVLILVFICFCIFNLGFLRINAMSRGQEKVKDEVLEVLEREGASEENTDIILKLIWCESKFKQYAYNKNKNGTVDKGILQWNSVHNLGDKPYDIEFSVKRGLDYIRKGKLSAWNSSKKCWSKLEDTDF